MATETKRINEFKVNAVADQPDARDWMYQPALVQLASEMRPPANLKILDQGAEGACTGFGLAASINLLNKKRKNNILVSPRMLYEMARKFDEWEGEGYSGSSCRGAIKGWANMGVCEDSFWPYAPENPGSFTLQAAKNARSQTIGAYYRLTPRIADFHAAINETGVIFCSANVHKGWARKQVKSGKIPFRKGRTGGHAFSLVGYNKKGFWVQNSWDITWGNKGIALWSYEDWEQNLIDAWIFSLALPTPQIKGRSYTAATKVEDNLTDAVIGPPRGEIQGHFVHIDDGKFCTTGKYFSDLDDVNITSKHLVDHPKYKHLVFYAHGGLNSPKDSANRVKDMFPVFKENGVYSYHWMYDTGIMEELKDILFRGSDSEEHPAGAFWDLDWWDTFLEKGARIPGRAFWREMKRGARIGFKKNGDCGDILQSFLQTIRPGQNRQLHLVGHSTGAILLAYLLRALGKIAPDLRVSSVHIMAPAATVELYKELYKPLLTANKFGIDRMSIYYLKDELERDDSVGPYRKSLLYFVSRSFEERIPEKILGMEKYLLKAVRPKPSNLILVPSKGKETTKAKSASKTHGGFDNDHYTMNTILRDILQKKPKKPFEAGYMD
jgi:pimeloyl-ACP methyl ester carboxylesterase